jgi:hypothetical protein
MVGPRQQRRHLRLEGVTWCGSERVSVLVVAKRKNEDSGFVRVPAGGEVEFDGLCWCCLHFYAQPRLTHALVQPRPVTFHHPITIENHAPLNMATITARQISSVGWNTRQNDYVPHCPDRYEGRESEGELQRCVSTRPSSPNVARLGTSSPLSWAFFTLLP